MAIAEQFAGLQMDQLIGAPLRAAADVSTQLANSTADFINRVGFDGTGKVRTVAFGYQKRSVNEDGTSNLDEMKVDIPMLAIVPIPNLQVDEVNVLFDMEVKQSERQESALDLGATISGTVDLGIVKVSVTGNVSAHQSNTRSSDNSAKYHVDVRATNHGTPEGLARVLDMMAANVAPMLVGSTLKDGNGQNLSEQAKIKAERLKALRQEISQIENRLTAARNGLDSSLSQLKKVGTSQLNVYQGMMTRKLNSLPENDPNAVTYGRTMDEINQSWSAFQNQAGDFVKMIADGGAASESGEGAEGVSELFALKALAWGGTEESTTADAVEYGASETYYTAITNAQKNAVEYQKNVSQIETELFRKKSEYSDAVSGKTPAVSGNDQPGISG